MNKLFIALTAAFAFNSAQAATSVSVIFGADDSAIFTVSTDDAIAGAVISIGSFGGLGYGVAELTVGVTNYLHFAVGNYGGPVGLSGQFTLLGDDFVFGNDTKFLTTLIGNVNANQTGFGDPYTTPISFGPLTQYPWISGYFDAPEITDTVGFNDGVAYISIPVYAVPEPETYAMLLAGLGLLGFSVRRRQK